MILGQFTYIKAETLTSLQIYEITPDYIKGYASQEGTIEVYNKGTLLGRGEVNGEFAVRFSSKITSTVLTVKFTSQSKETQTISVTYQPITKINKVNDK